jgi:hypothetical protein
MGLANFLMGKRMIRTKTHEGSDIFDTGISFLRLQPGALLYVWIEPNRSQFIAVDPPLTIDSATTADIDQSKLLLYQHVGDTSEE